MSARTGSPISKAAVEPFTPECAERIAGLQRRARSAPPRGCSRATARSGAAFAATGPSMAPFSNLTQHLVDTLNIVCGRFRRAGDKAVVDMHQPGRSDPRRGDPAAALAARRSAEPHPRRRHARLRPAGEHAGRGDPHAGRGPDPRAVRPAAPIPPSCLPDQRKAVEALKDLELLVVIDPYMSATASSRITSCRRR